MAPVSNRTIERYLAHWAEPEAAKYAAALGRRTFANALIVPVYAESADCLRLVLAQVGVTAADLVIAVINVPDTAPPPLVDATRALLTELKPPCGATLLKIDKVSAPIPRKHGVGAARKLGTDIALACYARGHLDNPWLYQTDADATLPPDYFKQVLGDIPQGAQGAIVCAHRHRHQDPDVALAARLYDAHMRYYVAGLGRAGSSYAYSTLGSTVTVHAQAYAAVRGFPRRNAAEDFYLLNKVAKTYGVISNPQIRIEVEARLSDRVPFGTGPALKDILATLRQTTLVPPERAYLSYHPQSFEQLKSALGELELLANDATPPPTPSLALLNRLGLPRVQEAMKRYPKGARRHKALTDWFDALRTLRFIHEARNLYPDQPLVDSLATELVHTRSVS